jgi:hypothetical protein
VRCHLPIAAHAARDRSGPRACKQAPDELHVRRSPIAPFAHACPSLRRPELNFLTLLSGGGLRLPFQHIWFGDSRSTLVGAIGRKRPTHRMIEPHACPTVANMQCSLVSFVAWGRPSMHEDAEQEHARHAWIVARCGCPCGRVRLWPRHAFASHAHEPAQ